MPTGRDLSKTHGKKSKKPKAVKQTRMFLSIERIARSHNPKRRRKGDSPVGGDAVGVFFFFCSCCFVCVFCCGCFGCFVLFVFWFGCFVFCCFGCFLLLFVFWFGCFVLLLLFWGVTKSATYHSNI